MSKKTSCSKKSAVSAPKKRYPSPEQAGESPLPSKLAKVGDEVSSELPSNSHGNKNGEDGDKVAAKEEKNDGNGESGLDGQKGPGEKFSATVTANNLTNADAHVRAAESAPSSDAPVSSDPKKVDTEGSAGAEDCRPSTSLEQSDLSAIAAAKALASFTRAAADEAKQTPCSSKKVRHHERLGHKVKRGERESSKERSKPERGRHTQAAAADSSTALRGVDREDAEDMPDEDDDSIPGSSSTPSSFFPSDNDDDGECAIVSVKMAPEIRQSLALLAQVQMRLDALEKKGARLHQRLELKMSRQRRPQLDQRSSITQAIPGFWVTALLNHPHLSAHIDETDEDALSYMTNLEIESFKNNKLGYRIGFHFRRNPYFQNLIIVKELHLGMGGSPVSFSDPILWYRGQNLTLHSEPRRSGRGIYQTFFSWFSDHTSPGRDDIAQILKDDLFRNPLRYYLTPLWEPRQNGSSNSTSGPKPADNRNRDDCVVISDSDDDEEQAEEQAKPGRGRSREEEDEGEDGGRDAGSDDSDQEAREDEDSSYREKDEEVDESRGREVRGQDDEEDIEVDEEEDEC
ncbi:testis-specific Y-encoded-like protein 4 isoform X1 [Coregonus clupeaformis]|uniref:testis-specific Y-encoded-like protein 4 isoform X1 n=1 Tax=Coregonus clupeaformis TaxID=59861 RepID=UPI001BE09FCD|nr:testis-specific Y-encoded-like protein 4 isoform X1 [Coregonus clupeaformis]